MSHTRVSKFLRALSSSLLVIAILSGSVLLLINRQLVTDSISGYMFSPSEEIKAIESNIDFTDNGRRIFYATKPSMLDAAEFNDKCPRRESGSPIIGCYSTGDNLYIYKISDPRLSGIEEITAAHETLHAVWNRMSSREKAELSDLLKDAYSKIDDDDLTARMDYYERAQPGEHYNELHSILGTEYSNLSADLESHYAKYFKDRDALLSYHSNYNSYYSELKSKSDSLVSELTELASKIESNKSGYSNDANQLSVDIENFNNKATSGSFSTMAEFEAERRLLVTRSNNLNDVRSGINSDIEKYNLLHEEYKKIASELDVLNKTMDSLESIESTPTI